MLTSDEDGELDSDCSDASSNLDPVDPTIDTGVTASDTEGSVELNEEELQAVVQTVNEKLGGMRHPCEDQGSRHFEGIKTNRTTKASENIKTVDADPEGPAGVPGDASVRLIPGRTELGDDEADEVFYDALDHDHTWYPDPICRSGKPSQLLSSCGYATTRDWMKHPEDAVTASDLFTSFCINKYSGSAVVDRIASHKKHPGPVDSSLSAAAAPGQSPSREAHDPAPGTAHRDSVACRAHSSQLQRQASELKFLRDRLERRIGPERLELLMSVQQFGVSVLEAVNDLRDSHRQGAAEEVGKSWAEGQSMRTDNSPLSSGHDSKIDITPSDSKTDVLDRGPSQTQLQLQRQQRPVQQQEEQYRRAARGQQSTSPQKDTAIEAVVTSRTSAHEPRTSALASVEASAQEQSYPAAFNAKHSQRLADDEGVRYELELLEAMVQHTQLRLMEEQERHLRKDAEIRDLATSLREHQATAAEQKAKVHKLTAERQRLATVVRESQGAFAALKAEHEDARAAYEAKIADQQNNLQAVLDAHRAEIQIAVRQSAELKEKLKEAQTVSEALSKHAEAQTKVHGAELAALKAAIAQHQITVKEKIAEAEVAKKEVELAKKKASQVEATAQARIQHLEGQLKLQHTEQAEAQKKHAVAVRQLEARIGQLNGDRTAWETERTEMCAQLLSIGIELQGHLHQLDASSDEIRAAALDLEAAGKQLQSQLKDKDEELQKVFKELFDVGIWLHHTIADQEARQSAALGSIREENEKSWKILQHLYQSALIRCHHLEAQLRDMQGPAQPGWQSLVRDQLHKEPEDASPSLSINSSTSTSSGPSSGSRSGGETEIWRRMRTSPLRRSSMYETRASDPNAPSESQQSIIHRLAGELVEYKRKLKLANALEEQRKREYEEALREKSLQLERNSQVAGLVAGAVINEVFKISNGG
ncbi:uncharacterized protein BJ171DRAFT_515234 [Polychytrium aggregatum]|uniref:uncharacterized protein n=1 Tax=Polychytrium aggregatum TaxID=110093 RepID=UPI0022FE327C|nr:uncharacterized protein BJ171DRAFT_515234 [Polychytrium aggregatum]KAI9202229.1 hypothetical protein BJ171DRAFT_515234 [Polychytrium aggregatum]